VLIAFHTTLNVLSRGVNHGGPGAGPQYSKGPTSNGGGREGEKVEGKGRGGEREGRGKRGEGKPVI